MHDGHIHGSCAECVSFVAAFPDWSGLNDWGYCEKQTTDPPNPSALAELGNDYLGGDRTLLQQNTLGVFRSEEDDACDFIRSREW